MVRSPFLEHEYFESSKYRTSGDTPMHDAVRLGRYRIVKTLILHGANLRVENQAKKSPIDMVQLWYKETKSTTTEARKKNSVAAKMTDLLKDHEREA